MFGISFAEFLIIAVLAVIFVRPEDMPKIARFLARTWIFVRAAGDKFSAYISQYAPKEDEVQPMFDAFQKQLEKMKRKMSEQDKLDLYKEIRNKKIPKLKIDE